MKKILFATTALVATAGVAAADVSVTGLAEFGIFKNENGSGDFASGDLSESQVFTDIDVTFGMSGEADNGLTFGASIDLDEARLNDQTDASRLGNATMFLAFGGMRLTVGDTDSAFDARLTETAIGGAINDDHTVHPGYNGNSGLDEVYGGQEIRFDYSFDAFTFSASTSPDRFGTFDPSYALGVSYATDVSGVDLGLGLGYIKADENAVIYNQAVGLSVSAGFANGLSAILNYTYITDTADVFDDANHVGLGLGYTMNALTVGVNYGRYDFDDFLGDSDGYGVTVNYDLGGGLEVQAGYGAGDGDFFTYEDTYSLGVAMSF